VDSDLPPTHRVDDVRKKRAWAQLALGGGVEGGSDLLRASRLVDLCAYTIRSTAMVSHPV
jgi:hypothetical protein